MFFTEDETIMIVFVHSILVHFLPVEDKHLLNSASDMERSMTIFEVTLNATSNLLFVSSFAVLTSQLCTSSIEFSTDYCFLFIIKPNIRDPIYTSNVDSSDISINDDSFQITAKYTTVLVWVFRLPVQGHLFHVFAP